jgi:hypothetical protein
VAAALLVGAAVVASALSSGDPAARYVLTARDVGSGYRLNPNASGTRTLSDVSLGDSARVRRELRQSWLGGRVAGFNAVSGTDGVISIVDVFRSGTVVPDVLAAWVADAKRVIHGVSEPLPANAPGGHPALIRGKLIRFEVLVYMWSHGRAIASVEVTGLPGHLQQPFLMKLARLQDAKLAKG